MTKTVADHGRGRVPGLATRTSPDGVVTYWFRFRLPSGKRTSMTFKGVGLAKARDLAKKAVGDVSHGRDPRPVAAAIPLTVTRACALWVRARRREWRRRTTKDAISRLRVHVIPEFGKQDARTLSRSEIWRHLRLLSQRHPVTANRALAILRNLYGWLTSIENEDLGVTANPTLGLRRPGGAEEPRSRTFSDAEVKAILVASAGTDEGDLIEWILLTGARDGEARGTLWSEVADGAWTISGSRTKNHKPRVAPLSSGARAVLARRRGLYASDRAFPQARQSKTLRKVAKDAGLPEPTLRLHDLRRTVGDRLRAEYGEATLHGVLGHQDARLTMTYGPTPRLKSLAEALEWWGSEVARIRSASS